MANVLTLWGAGTSRTMRAHWMLLELGLDYQFHPIGSRTGETQTDEFLQLNPRHKIPVLQHGSFVLTESAAIVQYLSNTFACPLIYTAGDHRSRAALDEWCYFIISELDASSLYVLRRHDGLKQLYGDAPTAVESAKTYFLHNLEAMVPRLERHHHPYLFGERLSVADVLLMTCLDWAASERIPLPEPVTRYRMRIALRPAYQEALARNFATPKV